MSEAHVDDKHENGNEMADVVLQYLKQIEDLK